jgi:hypothetical protein
VPRFFGQLKDLVTEKSQNSMAGSKAMIDSGNAQRTAAQKVADKTSSKLEDTSRKRTVIEEDNDIMMKPLHDELHGIGVRELFS